MAVHNNEIAAHAVVDVVVGKFGDIGLETKPAHRRKGLAAVTAAAAIESALAEHGLSEILWDCGEKNFGSLKTAEKLGLDYITSHTMYIFDLWRRQKTLCIGRELDLCWEGAWECRRGLFFSTLKKNEYTDINALELVTFAYEVLEFRDELKGLFGNAFLEVGKVIGVDHTVDKVTFLELQELVLNSDQPPQALRPR